MPSEVVHLALGALLAAALLGEAFDRRSLAVVLAAAAAPDLDTFLGMAVMGTHRAALHTLLVPLALAALIAWDTRFRERSFLRRHGDRWVLVPGTHRAALHTLLVPLGLATLVYYDTHRDRSWIRRHGDRGVLVAWTAVAAYALAGIGPDLFFNGVNPLYPVIDQFVKLDGQVYLSSQHGFVQTVWTFEGGRTPTMGTTASTHYATGVDPTPGADPPDVERIFPIAMSGLQLLVVLTAVVVTTVRLRRAQRR